MKGTNKVMLALVVLAILIVGYLAIDRFTGKDVLPLTVTSGATTSGGVTAGGEEVLDAGCNQNPAVTYAVIDKFTSASVSATNNIKENGKAPVSSLANPSAGAEIEYWGNISTYFVKPIKHKVTCGSNPPIQAVAYLNATPTMTVKDIANNILLTDGGGANNLTISANSLVNLEVSYQGTKNKAFLPFGGCMVIETTQNISSVSASGLGLSAGCPYQVTYNVGSTQNSYKMFNVPDGFDADGTGAYKTFTLQLQNGNAETSGTMKIVFYPASYYLANDGTFALDVEKAKNDLTDKTFATSKTFSIVVV